MKEQTKEKIVYKEIQSIRGMHDYLPEELQIWNYIENIIKEVLASYCYLEIRLPLLEKTEIFQRAIGNITDVVEKEMYSFQDRKGNSITLRPEGTVGCVRALIQNNLLYEKMQRFWYLGPMFRYERPQQGRYRQFHQFGAEAFGLDTEDIDLEMIMLTYRIWKRLGLEENIRLEINSIGSQNDRMKYKRDLVLFLKKYEHLLDEDCKRRLYTNPLRILDSKNIEIQKILTQAPLLNEYLDISSQNHFKKLCNIMTEHGIKYIHNKFLVRGLDYYNSTVFEWKSDVLGSQSTVCAGGRYNSLLQEFSMHKTSGIGFAIGMERLVFLARSLKIIFPIHRKIDIYIIVIGNNKFHAITLSEDIKNLYPILKIFINISNSPISKKIKKAVNSSSRIAIFIGDNEIEKGCFLVKDLKEKKQYFILKNVILQKIKYFFENDKNYKID